MEITPETATSLGTKLAALDLTPEEGVLLATLLATEDDVDGFAQKTSGANSLRIGDIKETYAPKVLGPIPRLTLETRGYTEVEWTY